MLRSAKRDVDSGVATPCFDPLPRPLAHPPRRTPPRAGQTSGMITSFSGGGGAFLGGVPARAAGGSRGGLRRAEQGS